MKMCFLSSGLFWGAVLILLGLSVILKAIFHIHIPVFRIVFALVLIYFGLRILIGGFGCRMKDNVTLFNHSRANAADLREEMSVIFGQGDIDATAPGPDRAGRPLKISTVFGESRIKISSAIPTEVRSSAVFGSAVTPDGHAVTFGEHLYRNKACSTGTAPFRIEVNVVFGNARVTEQ